MSRLHQITSMFGLVPDELALGQNQSQKSIIKSVFNNKTQIKKWKISIWVEEAFCSLTTVGAEVFERLMET